MRPLTGPPYPSWNRRPRGGCVAVVLFACAWLFCLAVFLGFVWLAVRVVRTAWGE